MNGFNFYGKYLDAISTERQKNNYQPPTKSIILLSISQMAISAIQKLLTAPLSRIKILQQTIHLPQVPSNCTNKLINDIAGNIINKHNTKH
jgi:hypothetical protein